MKDRTQQVQSMRAELLGISSNEPTKTEAVAPMKEPEEVDTIDTENKDKFMARFYMQETRDNGYIETNPVVFNQLTGGKPTPYVWFGGVRVYVKGTREKIEHEESIPTHQKLGL